MRALRGTGEVWRRTLTISERKSVSFGSCEIGLLGRLEGQTEGLADKDLSGSSGGSGDEIFAQLLKCGIVCAHDGDEVSGFVEWRFGLVAGWIVSWRVE